MMLWISELVKMNLIFKVFNAIVLVNSCSGGTVKRDTYSHNHNDVIGNFNTYPHPHYPYYQHPYGYYHQRENLCGPLQQVLHILYDSGVTTCQQLPKDFQGIILKCIYIFLEFKIDCFSLYSKFLSSFWDPDHRRLSQWSS